MQFVGLGQRLGIDVDRLFGLHVRLVFQTHPVEVDLVFGEVAGDERVDEAVSHVFVGLARLDQGRETPLTRTGLDDVGEGGLHTLQCLGLSNKLVHEVLVGLGLGHLPVWAADGHGHVGVEFRLCLLEHDLCDELDSERHLTAAFLRCAVRCEGVIPVLVRLALLTLR